jgi:hypothetical protein
MKHGRDASLTPTLMYSRYAGPVASVATGPNQSPPTTSEPARIDSVETEEGWKKVERKQGKGNAGEDGRACWRRSNLDRYIPGRGCERHRLHWLGGLATPSRRYTCPQKRGRSNNGNSDPFLPRQQDEREGVFCLVLLFFLFFCFCLCRLQVEEQGGEAGLVSWRRPGGSKNAFICICHDRKVIA